MKGCQHRDHEPEYWRFQQENLARQFREKISGRIESGEIRHLSVFGLAPQPLLIEFGRLLCDIAAAQVRQSSASRKAGAGSRTAIRFRSTVSDVAAKTVALKLALSATVTNDRIRRVLGESTPIWSITAEEPHTTTG
jgi:hypothetical protein